jgi:hypothetical protein
MTIEKLQIVDYSYPQNSVIAAKRVNLCNPTAMPKPSPHTCMLV